MSKSMRWGLLLTGLAVFLGVVWWLTGALVELPPPADEPVATSRPPPPPERGELGQPAELEPERARTPDPEPVAPPPSEGAPAVVAGPPPTLTPRPGRDAKDPDALTRETELLARARQEVAEDPEAALVSLLEYAQQFPQPALSRDADLVRVEAFLRLGRRGDAEIAAKKLVSEDPSAKKELRRLFSGVRQN
jgi:hypothetical protein